MSNHLADIKTESLFRKQEIRFINFMLPKIPTYIQTYHLTYMTLIWAWWILVSGYLVSQASVFYARWVIICLIWRSITDKLDGAVGRARNTWLVKRGFYMDHMFDVILSISLLWTAYMITPESQKFRVFILWWSLLVLLFHIFIYLSATDEFWKSMWPAWATEIQIALILLLLWVMYIPVFTFNIILPIVSILTLMWSILVVYLHQEKLWKIDMASKD